MIFAVWATLKMTIGIVLGLMWSNLPFVTAAISFSLPTKICSLVGNPAASRLCSIPCWNASSRVVGFGRIFAKLG